MRDIIKKSASIGANGTIVCSMPISEYAFMGSGTLMPKDVPEHALVIGNPRKVGEWVDKKGHKLKFDENGISTFGHS